jgi:thiol-disulfide isomerase/thioredoxin
MRNPEREGESPMDSSINRRAFFGAAAGALAATQFGMSLPADAQAGRSGPLGLFGDREMPSLGGATGWINTAPLTPADLRGKVVLVQFWTYTCINWLRAHAYVRAWTAKYRDQGLVVLGVHTPEFPFEKDVENIRRAVQDMRIHYPIAIDSDYAIWRAFRNQYWPAFYFVDAQGRIRHQQFGEGQYEQAEKVLQALLAEAGAKDIGPELASVTGQGAEAAPDWANLRSPETYLGSEQAQNFSSPGGAVAGRSRIYTAPARLARNDWSLAGDWTIEKGFAALNKAEGRVAYRFHARDVHLVMGAADPDRPVRFRIRIDGAWSGADRGADVDAEGMGSVREPRMYQLARQSGSIADRTFEIEFLESGVRAYCFTFG